MTLASDNYEMFTLQVLASLVGPMVTVHHQKSYVGRISHRDIVVDVSFNVDVVGANLLFLVECKNYKNHVPVDDVEEFHSKIDDIGAHKGIMVTTVGFQNGAIKTAEGRGIALALLTKDSLPGELRYVMNSAGRPKLPAEWKPSDNFWQGNLRGPLGIYGSGFRFDNFERFFTLLLMDPWTSDKRLNNQTPDT